MNQPNIAEVMGRKIKGKKHHGVKDPEKQRENREAAVKLKVIISNSLQL